MKAIQIDDFGPAENMHLVSSELGKPGEQQVLIKQTYVGVNHHDIHIRKGDFRGVKPPLVLGVEACGIVEEVGGEVIHLKPGDRICYLGPAYGAYRTHRIVDVWRVAKIPASISDEVCASGYFKAMTAHYLLRRTHMVGNNQTIIVTGATGGVGHILCQLAKYLGTKVIAIVSMEEKIPIAQKFGAEHVILLGENIKRKVMEVTNGEGVHAVYDCMGQSHIRELMDCLGYFGIYVAYGQISGDIKKFPMDLVDTKSLFFTRPSIFHYKAHRMERVLSSEDVLATLTKGIIKPFTHEVFGFGDVINAHKMIESRESVGSVVLKVE